MLFLDSDPAVADPEFHFSVPLVRPDLDCWGPARCDELAGVWKEVSERLADQGAAGADLGERPPDLNRCRRGFDLRLQSTEDLGRDLVQIHFFWQDGGLRHASIREEVIGKRVHSLHT